MRARAGIIAAVLVALALTGCSGDGGGEPEAVETTPPASSTPPASDQPLVSPTPAQSDYTEAEALYLGTARIFDLGLSDDELLETGWDICETRRSGEPVPEEIRELEFPATEALCRDVL